MYSLPSNQNYSIATGSSSTNPFVEVFFERDPTPYDVNFTIQKRWFNTALEQEWILVSFYILNLELRANWVLLASSTINESILGFDGGTGTTGFPVFPDLVNRRVTFTSSDKSVIITGDNDSHAIDFKVSASGGFEWTSVTENFSMEAGKGYIINSISYGTAITGNLPSTSSVGDTFKILEISGSCVIQLQTGQTLSLGRDSSSLSGSVFSNFITPSPVYATEGCSIEIICTVTNTGFRAFNWTGNWTTS